MWQVRSILGTEINLNSSWSQNINLSLEGCQCLTSRLDVEFHGLRVRFGHVWKVHAYSVLEVENWQVARVARDTHIVDAVKWSARWTVHHMCVAQVSEVVHLLHIVLCVIVNLKIPNHLLRVRQDYVVLAFVILVVLIKLSAALTWLRLDVEVWSLRIVACHTTAYCVVLCWKWSVNWALGTSWLAFYFSLVSLVLGNIVIVALEQLLFCCWGK